MDAELRTLRNKYQCKQFYGPAGSKGEKQFNLHFNICFADEDTAIYYCSCSQI